MKIAFFDSKKYDIESFSRYDHNDEFKFYDTKLTEDTVYLAKGYEAVCIFVNDTVDRNVIDQLYDYGIELILLRCAGYNNIDLEYCYNKVHVFHVPAYSPNSVAEYTMALLLTLIRKTHKSYIRTRSFNFSLEGLEGFNLKGKTIGIIGTGKIGRAFISLANGFSMKVIAYDIFPQPGIDYVSLQTLYRESDIISLHCPLTEETYHLINSEAISQMSRCPIIVNTSRGGIIDTDALLIALKQGKLKGACLDVYEEESDIFFKDYSAEIMNDDVLTGLINMPNVIVTSHQAYLTAEALDNIAETTIENYNSYFDQGYGDNELCYRCDRIDECIKNGKKKCF